MSMDQEAVAIITQALKAQGINLVVTLPEEPTSPLIHALREDAYFTIVDADGQGSGLAAAAGASLSGRTAIFVHGTRHTYGQAMRAVYLDALHRHPDFAGRHN